MQGNYYRHDAQGDLRYLILNFTLQKQGLKGNYNKILDESKIREFLSGYQKQDLEYYYTQIDLPFFEIIEPGREMQRKIFSTL